MQHLKDEKKLATGRQVGHSRQHVPDSLHGVCEPDLTEQGGTEG